MDRSMFFGSSCDAVDYNQMYVSSPFQVSS